MVFASEAELIWYPLPWVVKFRQAAVADEKKRLKENVDGDFFVDSTCENFDICRQLAPETFVDIGSFAAVGKQPATGGERKRALYALVSCPKGAIGTGQRASVKEVFDDFPLPVDDNVYFCGFNTVKSAGANSWFIKHEDGNWLVSTPKFVPHLVQKFERLGGVPNIFLSHRDDLGETEKYARHFNSNVFIHRQDLECFPAAQTVIEGTELLQVSRDFVIVPVPGHTEGHCMLLHKNKFLFSGDSLYFDRMLARVALWNPYWTWFCYRTQALSVEKLLHCSFEWLLTSHGQSVKLPPDEMKAQVRSAIIEAQSASEPDPMDLQRMQNLEYYAGEMRKFNQPVYADLMQQKANVIREAIESKRKSLL